MLPNHKKFALLIPHVWTITTHLEAYQFVVKNVNIFPLRKKFSLLNKIEVNSDTSKN